MSKHRSKSQQTKHDEKVASLARGYKNRGFKVKADLPGYPKPNPIGGTGRIPDIEATKPGTRHIVEVETENTVIAHKDQQKSFRQSARRRRRTKYRQVVI